MTVVGFLIDNFNNTGATVRPALSALTGYAPAARPLGANSGVRPGTSTSIGTAGSTSWSIGPHSGILDLETSAVAGPYFYAVTATETGTVAAASSSNDRIDLVTIRTNDPALDGSSTAGVTFQTYTGTPASSPSVPATPAGEFAMMSIRVPRATTGSPAVTWLANAWDDTGWQPITSINTGTFTVSNCQARQIGNRVYVRGWIQSNTWTGSGVRLGFLPSNVAGPATVNWQYDTTGTATGTARCVTIQPDGQVLLTVTTAAVARLYLSTSYVVD